MIFLTILYKNADPSTYSGVQTSDEGRADETFYTGDPTVDYLAAGAVGHYRYGQDAHFVCSSSVNHFVFDGGGLRDENPTQDDVKKALDCARAYLVETGEVAS